MALIVADTKKVYEKPDSGTFMGVIADVVDLGPVGTKFGVKNKVRIVWVLGKQDGSGYANDSEGNPFRVMSSVNATMNEKSDLFKLVRDILGAAPPVPYDVEQLLGKANLLFIIKEEDTNKKGVFYANVKGILPVPPNTPVLGIPATFVRSKDKKDNRTTPVTPAATVAQLSTISANLTGTGTAGQPAPAPAQAPAEVVLDEKF
jgi:hypothetical protein